MIALLTWIPDNGQPETLTVDLPNDQVHDLRALIGTPKWTASEAVAWINTKVDGQPWTLRLYRLARITALEPADAS